MAVDCDTKPDYNCVDLECTDAVELSRHSMCTTSPNPPNSMDEVPVGSCVEFNVDSERLWVKVLATCTCYLIGEVMPPMFLEHEFKVGDLIRIEIQNIYNIDTKTPRCRKYKSIH